MPVDYDKVLNDFNYLCSYSFEHGDKILMAHKEFGELVRLNRANMIKLVSDNRILLQAVSNIRKNEGRVCEGYEMCEHNSCGSSYNSWAIASKAIDDCEIKED